MNIRAASAVTLVSLLSPLIAQAAFSDVPPRHENWDAINYVQELGIVSGYPDGTFKPDQVINRAEYTKIVMGAIASAEELNDCDTSTLSYFDDAPADTWYSPYVCLAHKREIVRGNIVATGKPQLRPDNPTNFVEAAKILTVAFNIGLPPMNCEGEKAAVCAQSASYGQPWYKQHITELQNLNAIPLSITSIDQYITRGQMAEMIYRLHAGDVDKPSHTYNELLNVPDDVPAPLSEWKIYNNYTLGYSMEYDPSLGEMSSNTFGVQSAACVLDGKLGPLDIMIREKASTYDNKYLVRDKQNNIAPVKEQAETVWKMNMAELSTTKNVGTLEEVRVNGKTAYRFWVTGSVKTLSGGWLAEEKEYLQFFDNGDIVYLFGFAADDQDIVNQMLASWKDIPVRYTAESAYEAADECDLSLR